MCMIRIRAYMDSCTEIALKADADLPFEAVN